MRLARFMADGKDQWGVVHGDELALVRGDVFGGFGETDHSVPLASVALLPPCRPEKCVCVGLNYSDHAAELNMPVPDEPILFLKPPTSLCAPFGDIAYPPMTRELHYEAELAVVVGRGGKEHPRGQGGRPHPGVRLCQRRHGPGPATQGRSVDPSQGLRHLPARGPLAGNRSGPRERGHPAAAQR